MSDPADLAKRIQQYIDIQQEVYAPLGSSDFAGMEKSVQETNNPVHKHIESASKTVETDTADNAQTLNPDYPSPKMIESLNACSTLDELKNLCDTADILKTDLADTRLVFGKGNPHADLMIIGEAPGAKEDALGEPFVGASGNLLTKILEAIKIERSDIYIANILKHRPPENRNPSAEERKRSLPFLERQIDIIQPKLILCLGLVSAQTLLGTTQALKDLRSEFHPYRNSFELMVTYHPAALLRNKHLKRDTWEDVQKLRARYDELGGKPAFESYK